MPPQARGVEPDQVTGYAYLFGVGLRHPKGSLLMDAEAVPVAWLVRVRCAEY